MARARNKISPKSDCFKRPGRHSDGGGLYLAVDGEGESQRRRWLFLFNWNGKRREMGLGGYPAVGLAAARKARDDAEALLRQGIDPIAARSEAKKVEPKAKPTFGQMADAYLASKKAQWRNDKHRAQWEMTLTKYAAPIRSKPVDEISTADVLELLTPFWQKTPETASRLRGRVEIVLDAARALGHIPSHEANPARWKGHLDKLLPKRPELSRKHHAAMPYTQIKAFMARLRERDAMAACALEFCILTGARTSEVLMASWSEIDFQEKVWTVPAHRMKKGREHRVPLSGRAMAVLEKLAEAKTGEYIFPGQKQKRPLSNMSMEMVLRRMDVKNATVHGFRSTFRDWAGNETNISREVAEAALSHAIGDKAEQAYRRGDALAKRRALMEAWAQYCEPATGANVLAFAKPGAGG